MKGLVFKSRHTPGLANAVDVKLPIGTRITHSNGGKPVGAVIRSELMQHTNGAYGYECIFFDTDKLEFADEKAIIKWEGKVD